MANGYGGGLGQPGTKIIKSETEGGETKAHIFDAAVFSLAGDLIGLCLLVIVALTGWPSVIPMLILSGLGFVLFALWFCKVPRFFVFVVPFWRAYWHPSRLRYAPLSFATSREIVLKWTAILSALAGTLAGRAVWNWFTANGALGRFILDIAGIYLNLSWYVPAAAGLLLAVFIVKGKWREGLAILAMAVSAWGVYSIGTSEDIATGWVLLASRARYIAIPFVAPWIIGAALVMLVTAKNMLFPYLDFNLRPIGLDEVREIGLVGLWLPRLLGGPAKEPTPDRLIKVEVSERDGKTRRYADLPNKPELIEFCKAVYRGVSFSLREARGVGLSRREFETIRDVFIDRGWARWANTHAKAQGVELLAAGRKVIENIALDRSVS